MTGRVLVALMVVGGVIGGPAASLASASPPPAVHVVGTWPDTSESGAGGWMLWSNGKVQPVGSAPFYGDARRDGINAFVGMIASTSAGGAGYWLVTKTGRLLTFGPACGTDSHIAPPNHVPTSDVVGLVDRDDGYAGFQMVTSGGAMYSFECQFND